MIYPVSVEPFWGIDTSNPYCCTRESSRLVNLYLNICCSAPVSVLPSPANANAALMAMHASNATKTTTNRLFIIFLPSSNYCCFCSVVCSERFLVLICLSLLPAFRCPLLSNQTEESGISCFCIKHIKRWIHSAGLPTETQTTLPRVSVSPPFADRKRATDRHSTLMPDLIWG